MFSGLARFSSSIFCSKRTLTSLFPCSLKSYLPNDSGFVPDPGDLGREWRFPFWAHALKFWHCMDLSRYSFSSILGNKTNTSSCQRKVGICPSALITAIARGCCSSFYQCWIWPWSKMCLCNPSWSQIAGSFSFFILFCSLPWEHFWGDNIYTTITMEFQSHFSRMKPTYLWFEGLFLYMC